MKYRNPARSTSWNSNYKTGQSIKLKKGTWSTYDGMHLMFPSLGLHLLLLLIEVKINIVSQTCAYCVSQTCAYCVSQTCAYCVSQTCACCVFQTCAYCVSQTCAYWSVDAWRSDESCILTTISILTTFLIPPKAWLLTKLQVLRFASRIRI